MEHWKEEIENIDQRVNLSGWLNPDVKYKVRLSAYDQQIENPKQLTQLVDADLLKELYKFGVVHGVSLNSILQFAWHKVLNAYGGGSHTIVGVTGHENTLLSLLVDHLKQGEQSVVQAIQGIQKKMDIINASERNLELGKLEHSLFDTLFVLETDMESGFKMVADYEKLTHPLTLIATENQGALKLTLLYAEELFQEEILKDALELLEYFLEQVAANPEQLVRKMELVLPKQLHLLSKWNETGKPFPSDKTLHAVFEEAAESNPSRVALVFDDKKWTYRELNERANQLARYLRNLGGEGGHLLKPDDRVAVIMKKNDLLILSILGVWKAGAAFVPIDPSYPEERLQFMLEDTEAKVVITNDEEGISEVLDGILQKLQNPVKVVKIEKILKDDGRLSSLDNTNFPSPSSSTNLCHVIYTSGTTGKPKGVMIEHRGIVNLHDSMSTKFGLKSSKEEEVILSFSNFVFDHFVQQMTDALLSGQTLLVLNDDMRTDKERLYNYIRDNRVTFLSGTPSVLSLYECGGLDSIKRIEAIGEEFSRANFNKIRSTFTSGLIINGYGPTETSIISHTRTYDEEEKRSDKSIGHQIYNSSCYILNPWGQRVPIGAVGELYLGGVGVGRGYLNREELTRKSFVKNEFATEEDRRKGRNGMLYKTGDLARFLGNGEVECLGRNDCQVKIRGLRIELSEIESVVLSHPGISRCVVVAQNREEASGVSGGGGAFLIGYYVSQIAPQDEEGLLSFLRTKLPTFMIPNRLVQVESIPVTINGKVDARRLPKVEFSISGGDGGEGGTSLTEVEIKLRFIWSDLLDLPPEQIGSEADFFSLGGDSLLVTRMSFMIQKAFGRVIRVPDVFLHRTVKALAQLISQIGGASSSHQDKIPKVADSPLAPASLAQDGLLFIEEMEGGTSAFNIPFIFKLKSDDQANIKMVKESLKMVAFRHQSLRTLLLKSKSIQDSFFQQRILNEHELDSIWPSAIQMKKVSSKDEAQDEIRHCENHIFKLDQELLWKVTFIKDTQNMEETLLSIVFHHCCFDGWSFPIFQRDWMAFYKCLLDGGDANKMLPKLDYHYGEYSQLQRDLLSGSNSNLIDTLSSYWLRKLSHVEQLNLPTDFERPSKYSYAGFEITRMLDSKLSRDLKELAKATKSSLYSVVASALAFTLSVYSGQEEILIGAPVSNRIRSEFQNVIGFFINILPLAISVKQNNMTVEEFLEHVGGEVVTSHVNQDMPFERMVKDLKMDKDLSRHPLVQVVMNFNPLAGPSNDKGQGPDQLAPFHLIEDIEGNKDTKAKYDLTVTVIDKMGEDCTNEDGLLINFTFAKSLFCLETVEGFLETFIHFLTVFSRPQNIQKRLNQLDLISKDKSLIMELEPHIIESTPYHHDVEGSSLPEIFEHISKQCGSQIALVFQDKHVSYEELNSRSGQLASLLRKKISYDAHQGAGNRRVVGLVMNKSDWMITAILGIWKSGAAYVPIDPTYPEERIRFILEDTEAKLLVCDEANQPLLSQIIQGSGIQLVAVDAQKTLKEMETFPPSPVGGVDYYKNNLRGKDLSYVIYTSGSTGRPKGVMISNDNIMSMWDSLLLNHKRRETVLFLSNFVFDLSIEQLLLSIFNWGKLIIIEKDFVIDDQLYSHLNEEGLTYLSGTQGIVTAFDLGRLSHLGTLTVGGEKLKQSHFTKIRKEFGGRFLNAYGVTETTAFNSLAEFPTGDVMFRNSLGRFLPNSRCHVLDKNLRPVPKGAVAELYLSGPCISQGYLNLEEMNRKHFLPNPNNSSLEEDDEDKLLYKTGDLVRMNCSGELEYLCRNDHQVKVRGFRIELQEVESAILQHGKISKCAVICEDNNLIGIFILKEEEKSQIAPDELKSFLENSLPPHMIPSYLIEYDEGRTLPVTINGKLDAKKLKEFYNKTKSNRCIQSSTKSMDSAPANKIEEVLCKIFCAVLGLPESDIGVHDDFFRLGGDSISSLLLAGKIRNQLGVKASVKHVFDYRTIRRLSENLCGGGCGPSQMNGTEVARPRPTGTAPLLPIQQWFFAKHSKSLGHFNQQFMIRVPHELDIPRLTQSLQQLIGHHDAFRLRFRQSDSEGGYTQHYEDDNQDDLDLENNNSQVKLNLHRMDVTGLEQTEIEAKLQQWSASSSYFDLEQGPLYAVVYLEDRKNNDFRLGWIIHHLIVDSVSWRILKDDLETLYQGGSLPVKGTSYKDFSISLRDSNFLEEKKTFWDPIVEQVPSYNAKLIEGDHVLKRSNFSFSLDPESTKRLLDGAQRGEGTETGIQDYLLTAVAQALKELTNSPVNYVTLEGHGREDIVGGGDLSNTVGWFTTMYPVKIEADIQKVKEALKSIPNKGIGYGSIYGYVEPPMPRVSFNYLGTFGRTNNKKNGEDEWKLCDLSLGLSTSNDDHVDGDSANVIDITAACDQGSLKCSINFLLKPDACQNFINTFQRTLKNLAETCLGVDNEVESLPFGDYETYYEFPSEMKPESDMTTLFLLPPGEGGAESYFNNLVPTLRKSFKLVVFNNYYLDQGLADNFDTSFEQLASMYLKYVKKIQPRGPYNFLGWSFGGVLALEMSRQLANNSGEDPDQIDNIYLIDSYLNIAKALNDTNLLSHNGSSDVIDKINLKYKPTLADFTATCSKTRKITLFKATLPNELATSKEKHLLFEYFRQSKYNNLETLIPPNRINLKVMDGHSHNSWAKDPEQVDWLSSVVIAGGGTELNE